MYGSEDNEAYFSCTSVAYDDDPVTADAPDADVSTGGSQDSLIDDRYERVRVNTDLPAWHVRQPPASAIVRGWRRRLRSDAREFFPPSRLNANAKPFHPPGVASFEFARSMQPCWSCDKSCLHMLCAINRFMLKINS